MRWQRCMSFGLAACLGGALNAHAQTRITGGPSLIMPSQSASVAQPITIVPYQPTTPSGIQMTQAPTRLPSGTPSATSGQPTIQIAPGSDENAGGAPPSRVEERMAESGQPQEPALGPTPPEKVNILQDILFGQGESKIKIYGWLDSGYTYSSTGSGILTVEPRENRFGNELLLNQAAIVLEKPLDAKELSWGFNATFYAGADAALLRPEGGFTTTNPRFGADFRQLYVSAHLPILSEGGVDIKAGRQGTILGYESALAPYRPFYSNDYQWFYSEDGAWTGVLANWHVNKQLDVLSGITFGANTFFTQRGDSPCYIGQANYWTSEEKNTLLTASVQAGNQAIFSAPGFVGDFQTVVELRVLHNWSKYFTQVVQAHLGWETGTPGIGTTQWYGLYTIMIYHLNRCIDVNFRADWFDDQDGSRTGFRTAYEETTLGVDYHPRSWLSLRPEIRGDFADEKVFRNGRDNSQLTLAMDALIKF